MRPVLVLNPRTDEEFAAYARQLASNALNPELYQALLRQRYPRALVRPRQLAGESGHVWYVYREGRWISDRGKGGGRNSHERQNGRPTGDW